MPPKTVQCEIRREFADKEPRMYSFSTVCYEEKSNKRFTCRIQLCCWIINAWCTYCTSVHAAKDLLTSPPVQLFYGHVTFLFPLHQLSPIATSVPSRYNANGRRLWLTAVVVKQAIALKGRNITGPPRSAPGELRCICECYRRRQTPATVISLAPTLYVDGPVTVR